ncbi:MAG: metallophosphoesterase family protein [Chloroflexota bacterium]
MRIAVLSDIHGNLPALQAVLSDMEPFAPEGIIVAGDTACGPQVNECVRLLRQHPCWAILGNNEEYMLRFDAGAAPSAFKTHRQFGLLRWAYRQLHPQSLEYFRALPAAHSLHLPATDAIRIVHGTPRCTSESIFPISEPASLEQALAQIDEPVLVCGHTHLPWWRQCNGKLALNPGAVGGSLDGDVRARYMLLDWEQERWQVTVRAVPYNLDEIRSAFHHSGLLAASEGFGLAFLRSIESGRNCGRAFLNHAYQLAGIPGDQPLPDDIWEQASQTFDFDQEILDEDYCL